MVSKRQPTTCYTAFSAPTFVERHVQKKQVTILKFIVLRTLGKRWQTWGLEELRKRTKWVEYTQACKVRL